MAAASFFALALWLAAATAMADNPGAPGALQAPPTAAAKPLDEGDRRFRAAMEPEVENKRRELSPDREASRGIDLLKMASPSVGGIFMYPIYFFSFVVVLFAFERLLALRRAKVVPAALVYGFGQLSNAEAGLDPRKAYRLCQQYPSSAANIVRSMLLKTGRPHNEVEQTVTKANEREAEKLYTNVRPINLAASAAPLLGLLGTVQGMIMAFYATAHLPDGANKAQFLAEGVYVALITTFAGLCVAIPAVCISHYLEGKIQRRFREIDELVYSLLPQLERFEGRLRVTAPRAGQAAARPEPKAEIVRQPTVATE